MNKVFQFQDNKMYRFNIALELKEQDLVKLSQTERLFNILLVIIKRNFLEPLYWTPMIALYATVMKSLEADV